MPASTATVLLLFIFLAQFKHIGTVIPHKTNKTIISINFGRIYNHSKVAKSS